jgi:hypothetical protein
MSDIQGPDVTIQRNDDGSLGRSAEEVALSNEPSEADDIEALRAIMGEDAVPKDELDSALERAGDRKDAADKARSKRETQRQSEPQAKPAERKVEQRQEQDQDHEDDAGDDDGFDFDKLDSYSESGDDEHQDGEGDPKDDGNDETGDISSSALDAAYEALRKTGLSKSDLKGLSKGRILSMGISAKAAQDKNANDGRRQQGKEATSDSDPSGKDASDINELAQTLEDDGVSAEAAGKLVGLLKERDAKLDEVNAALAEMRDQRAEDDLADDIETARTRLEGRIPELKDDDFFDKHVAPELVKLAGASKYQGQYGIELMMRDAARNVGADIQSKATTRSRTVKKAAPKRRREPAETTQDERDKRVLTGILKDGIRDPRELRARARGG